MNEQQIRQIVRQELSAQAYQSGAPIVPRHTHDNVNSPKIVQSNIIPTVVFNGSIDMIQGTITGTAPNQVFTPAIYYIPTVANARSVRFYGGALNTTASPAIHAFISGECSLVTGYQYQKATTNTVSLGTTPDPFVQSSGSIITYNGNLALTGNLTIGYSLTGSNATSILRNSQGHIVYCADGSSPENVYAQATIVGYNNSQIIIQVAMQTNWKISGTWVVS